MWPRTELNSGRSPHVVTKSIPAVRPTFKMLQLPGGCNALWRGEQEHHLRVTPREGQIQLHPQPVLRATQYFWGSGLPWKGLRPASRSWAYTVPPRAMCGSRAIGDPSSDKLLYPRAEWGGGRTLKGLITKEENPPEKLFLIQLTISK